MESSARAAQRRPCDGCVRALPQRRVHSLPQLHGQRHHVHIAASQLLSRRQGRHSAGFLSGVFGGAASPGGAVDEANALVAGIDPGVAVAMASAPSRAFHPAPSTPPRGGRGAQPSHAGSLAAPASADAPDPLALFDRVERPAIPTSAVPTPGSVGHGAAKPAEGVAASAAASEDGEGGLEREEKRRDEKAKTQRLKKLLAAADKRLQQAEADLQLRDSEIAALKRVAGRPSGAPPQQ